MGKCSTSTAIAQVAQLSSHATGLFAFCLAVVPQRMISKSTFLGSVACGNRANNPNAAPALRQTVLVRLFVLRAVSCPHACRRRELFAAVFAEEISLCGAGERVPVVSRIGAVARPHA